MRATPVLPLLVAALGVSTLRADPPEPFLIDSMPPLAPDTRRETLQATDASWHDCLVFTTVPGVLYTIQRSSDLHTWTDETSHYGLGHDFATALRGVDGPEVPAPPGGGPPPNPVGSLRLVSITLRPSAGAGGGTVVAWPSLHGVGPAVALIQENLDAAWAAMPLYVRDFDGWMFFIRHTSLPANPPAADDPPHAGLDANMLASFQQHLPTITAEVQASVERSRNSPPPAPPDPDGRRFWRVKADWSADTDGDGSADWIEFAGAALPLVPGMPPYDPFNPDADSNGTADGEQHDYDSDGTANAIDRAPANAAVSFPIEPPPRYAFFQVTGIVAEPHQRKPMQISDRGTVLFETGVWRAGEWHPLLLESGTDVYGCEARAINDSDVILGLGAKSGLSSVCIWPSPQAQPLIPAPPPRPNGEPRRVTAGYDLAYKQLNPGPVLSANGRFFAESFRKEGGSWILEPMARWQLPVHTEEANPPPGTGQMEETPGSGNMQYVTDDDADGNLSTGGLLTWGSDHGSAPPTLHVADSGVSLPPCPLSSAKNVARGGPGIYYAMSDAPAVAGWVFFQGVWRKASAFTAVDMSADGIFIGKNLAGGPNAPILYESQWVGIDRTAPSIPAEWDTPDFHLLDTTRCGWILAEKRSGVLPTGADAPAVMLPFRVKREWNGDTDAVGVDDVSAGASRPDDAATDRIWMLAADAEASPVSYVIKAPVSSATALTLGNEDAEHADVLFNGTEDSAVVGGPEIAVALRAAPGIPSGAERPLAIRMGAVDSLSRPLGVKVMKTRILRVRLYLVAPSEPAGTSPEAVTLDPTSGLYDTMQRVTAATAAYLNRVFQPQLNTTVSVTFGPHLKIHWDLGSPPNGLLDTGTENHTMNPEQAALHAVLVNEADPPHIRVFLMPGNEIKTSVRGSISRAMRINPDPAPGQPAGQTNACWVATDINSLAGPHGRPPRILRVMAHEIGHVLVGYGHPDENSGAAPLPGTDHARRLMFTGTTAELYRDARLLVKGEWDMAEKWLVKTVDPPAP